MPQPTFHGIRNASKVRPKKTVEGDRSMAILMSLIFNASLSLAAPINSDAHRPERLTSQAREALQLDEARNIEQLKNLLRANISDVFYGTNNGLPVSGSSRNFAEAMFLVLEEMTLENSKAFSEKDLRTAKQAIADQYFHPLLEESFPKNIAYLYRILPILTGHALADRNETEESDFLHRFLLRQKRNTNPRQITKVTPQEQRRWVQLYTLGFYLLPASTLSDIHWAVGRDYFEQSGLASLTVALHEVTKTYLEMPEQEMHLSYDRGQEAGHRIIRALAQYADSAAFQVLGLLARQSRHQKVAEAAIEVLQAYAESANPAVRDEAEKALPQPFSWRQFAQDCLALLRRSLQKTSR